MPVHRLPRGASTFHRTLAEARREARQDSKRNDEYRWDVVKVSRAEAEYFNGDASRVYVVTGVKIPETRMRRLSKAILRSHETRKAFHAYAKAHGKKLPRS